MAEVSLPWTGGGGGDDGPYAADNWTDIWGLFMHGDEQASRGVARGYLNELLASHTGGTTIRVQTGGAVVDGSGYISDANVDVDVPLPVGATRVDRIVLRKSWAGQTVRITRIAGAEGGGAPAITQTDGVTWDLPLWQISVTVPGVYTLTDQRDWLRSPIEIGTDNIEDEAVTEAKLADGVFVPVGGIILWSGAVGAIPTNWQICDGTGGTPDLRDKFVVGAGSGYAVGATGGSVSHTHTVGIASDLGGAHTHSVVIDSGNASAVTANSQGANPGNTTPNHTHLVNGTTGVSAQHQHGVNGNTGSSSTLPPYHALCYIMRTA